MFGPQINPNQIKANFVRTKRCNLLGCSGVLLIFLSPCASILFNRRHGKHGFLFLLHCIYFRIQFFFFWIESLSRWAQALITNLLLRYLTSLGFRWATEYTNQPTRQDKKLNCIFAKGSFSSSKIILICSNYLCSDYASFGTTES